MADEYVNRRMDAQRSLGRLGLHSEHFRFWGQSRLPVRTPGLLNL